MNAGAPGRPRHLRGRIAYLSSGGIETGREFFSVTVFPDGRRTLRCECHFEDRDLVRDVIFTLDADWHPVDAYLRVAQSQRFLGSGWYRFDANGTTCEAIDAERRVQRVVRPSATRAPACGFHPIVNDGLWTALFDLGRPDAVQRLAGCITCSKEQIGSERLGIESFDLELRYRGLERVTVAAGTFDCRHLEVLIPGLEAPFRLWVWSDDFLIVKESWAEMPGNSFELAALDLAPST